MIQQFPLIPKEEIERLQETIKLLAKILNDLRIEYRIFGSIIPATILGRPQRTLGDIDLMIDFEDKNKLFSKLKEKGYKWEERRFKFLNINFVWAEAVKNSLPRLTIFLGRFDHDKNFIVEISKSLKAVAHNQAIKPTNYNFYECSFVGIPKTTAYYGALASRGNPKRKYDLAVFEVKKIEKPPKGCSVIDFYYKEIKLAFFILLLVFCRTFWEESAYFLVETMIFGEDN